MPTIHTHIAGVKFRPNAVNILKDLNDGTEFQLDLDPTNKFDATAVKILYSNDHVGFIPAFLSKREYPHLKEIKFGSPAS